MNEKRNYQRELEELLTTLTIRPTLLLHCCCAPCSSYSLEYLSSYFDITVFFYNPNITEQEEYEKRRTEEIRFLQEYPFYNPVHWMEAEFQPEQFWKIADGLENVPEGGIRCFQCYELRLRQTAKAAKVGNFDYFCTTLSISPHKNADKLMEIGEKLQKEYQVKYLPTDLKKKNGYKRSIELSGEYHLYRQNYCGCIFSKLSAGKRDAK